MLLVTIPFGCRQDNSFSSDFEVFPDCVLPAGKNAVFHPFGEESDSLHFPCAVTLAVRYSDKCLVTDLPLNMEYLDISEDSVKGKRIDIPLFDKDNRPLGKGSHGIYEISFPLFNMVEIGKAFFIALSSEDNIDGIISIGIISNKIE